MLEIGREAHHSAARWTDSVTGKEPSKIDNINNVGKVLQVDLKAHIQPFRLVYLSPRGCAHLESGVDATSREVHAIDHRQSISLNLTGDALLKSQAGIALELEG